MVKDQIYVIEGFRIDWVGEVSLYLIGVNSMSMEDDAHKSYGRIAFRNTRFRLLDHLKEFNSRKQEQTQNL